MRQAILSAALTAYSEKGAAATVEDVRRLSGASVGSIYHHFGGKEGLAAALYVEALRSYQDGFLAVLEREQEAERGVRALVRHHLRWVAAHPDLARLLLAGAEPGAAERARAPEPRGVPGHLGVVSPQAEDGGDPLPSPRPLYAVLWAPHRSSPATGSRDARRARCEGGAVLADAAWDALRRRRGDD